MVTAGGRAPRMQPVAYSHPMQYATVHARPLKLGLVLISGGS